jgi:predicted nucleotidyltransferase
VSTYPLEVALLIDALLPRIEDALGDNLAGVYLCGSLALGGFDPQSSDVDVLVVTELPVSDREMAALRVLHDLLPPAGNEFGLDYEVYYIDRLTLRRFAPGQRHVKVGIDDPFGWTEHRPNWVLERWTVREHGVTLLGADPQTLIDPVSPDEMREAAAGELRIRLGNWMDGRWPRSELRTIGTQAFEVETVCRALQTVETGKPDTKRAAVAWALAALPERWHALIEWADRQRKDTGTDESRVAEVLEFLRWGVAETG